MHFYNIQFHLNLANCHRGWVLKFWNSWGLSNKREWDFSCRDNCERRLYAGNMDEPSFSSSLCSWLSWQIFVGRSCSKSTALARCQSTGLNVEFSVVVWVQPWIWIGVLCCVCVEMEMEASMDRGYRVQRGCVCVCVHVWWEEALVTRIVFEH